MRDLLVWFDTDSSILENKFCCGLKILIKVAVYSVYSLRFVRSMLFELSLIQQLIILYLCIC